jgi:hypothetical protein
MKAKIEKGQSIRKKFPALVLMTCFFILLPFTAHADKEQTVDILVQRGDTLINICEKYLEIPSKWREIARINKLDNPDLIYPGTKLSIPERLLKAVSSEGIASFVKGNVQHQPKGSDTWIPLRLNDRVKEGSTIKTGDESGVEIVFSDGNSILQRSNTVLGISSARKQPNNQTSYGLIQETGRTITKIKRKTGSESRFRIDTPSAICAARGTVFRTSIDALDSTRTEVVEGDVDVEAMKKNVRVQEGEGTLVKKGEKPLEPRKLLPPPAPKNILPLYKSVPFEIAFGHIEDAVAYRAIMAKEKDFKDIVKEQVIEPGDPFKVYVPEDGTYFLASRSIDALGLEGLSSKTAAIKVRMNPMPPSILSPVSNARYADDMPLFEWLTVQDAVRYHLQVAQDRTFAKMVVDKPALRDTQYEPRQFEPGTYYFRLRSIASDGYEGEWSDILSFTIGLKR